MTLNVLSTQVRILVPGHYIGGSSTGLGKAQCIDIPLRADWLGNRRVSGAIEEGRNVTTQLVC